MICYRDMTFCVSSKCENRCGRKLTEKIEREAEAWWGGPGAPIAMAEFCDGRGDVIKAAPARGAEEEKDG